MNNIKYPLSNPHSTEVQDLLGTLRTSIQGLNGSDATERNKLFGLNRYESKKEKNILLILFDQFKNPIVYLLLFGSAVSFYFKDLPEGFAILAVILINAAIGFFMEMQARNSMNALKQMDVILTKVYRDGILHEISADNLTPGDIIFIEAGDVIPADGRLMEANQMQCDESSLTGESLPAEKNNALISKEAPLGDRHNMVFKGTFCVKGNGKIIITGIGANTELGKITSLVEGSQETTTPLDKKLNGLTRKLIWLTLIIITAFAVSGLIRGEKAHKIIETAIALAVAAIPEGLPIVATIALAYGMLKMARKNAIVKKLSAVETLGGTTVILTDKTGTLTENKIFVNTLLFPNASFEAGINDLDQSLRLPETGLGDNKSNFDKILIIAALCNNAAIEGEKEDIKEIGDPLEIGLIKLVNSSGLLHNEYKNKFPRINEFPFSSETKIMGTLHANGNSTFVAAKGSVEHLINNCNRILINGTPEPASEQSKRKIIEESERLAAEGLRVLAFAYSTENKSDNDFMRDLIYAGSIGFLDPPRTDVKEAILSCREAGIRIIMVTGDHPKTAQNIARKVGLVDMNNATVMNGSEFPDDEVLSDKFKDRILNTSIFARATPKQKLDIAGLYQSKGNIVAMTGDGVNDAPALKKADVGIAMGLRGTQVAKETADIILKNDSFVSIAEAVAHGRIILQNIQKFVVYLISCNLAEIFIVTLLGFILPEATLLPLQILFLNMITDVFPALALGMGEGNKFVMKSQPRNPMAPIINRKQWMAIVYYAAIITVSIVAGVYYCHAYITPDPVICNNVAFLSLALSQLWHVFNMNSARSAVFRNEITRNRFVWMALGLCFAFITAIAIVGPLRNLLGIQRIDLNIVILCTIASILPLFVIQLLKQFPKRTLV
jgi:P-type Ca2+ transporter type 2C